MICLPYLPASFDTLNNPKEQGTNHQEDRHPEPLNSFPVIKPPLLDGSWTRIIKVLLQDDESVMPKMEVVNLSFLQLQLTTLHCARIQAALCLLPPKPLLGDSVMSGE